MTPPTSFTGLSGVDTLDGAGGGDTLDGGTENDIYIVDTQADTIIESAGKRTADGVMAHASFALAADDDIEFLETKATAAINLTGNALKQTITGNAGANIIDGGVGPDVMAGGAGSDTYIVDNLGDEVIEANGGGIDLVKASVSFFRGGSEIENLTLTGASVINGTGNWAANTIVGNPASTVIAGSTGLDTLTGAGGRRYYRYGSRDVPNQRLGPAVSAPTALPLTCRRCAAPG